MPDPVFELTPSGNGNWVEKVLYSFQGGSDGRSPFASLVFDSAGNLYGTTSTGPGTVFKLTPTGNGSWVENVLYVFPAGNGGYAPLAGLIFDANGNLYGTTSRGGVTGCGSVGCGTVFELSPIAGGQWAEAVLYRFTGKRDGATPEGGLVTDPQGNLFGNTMSATPTTAGVVFELTP